MSLLLHKDRGQVLVVNREEKEASPPSYPFGVRRACTCNRHPPKVVWTSLPSRLSPKCRSPGTGQMPGTTSNKTSAISRRVRQQAPLNLCQFRQE
jgi:hypothetical protein